MPRWSLLHAFTGLLPSPSQDADADPWCWMACPAQPLFHSCLDNQMLTCWVVKQKQAPRILSLGGLGRQKMQAVLPEKSFPIYTLTFSISWTESSSSFYFFYKIYFIYFNYIFFLLFFKINFYWNRAALQCCVSFYCTAKWTSSQFSSLAQSCPTLWDPMDCSTPGFPVLHKLLLEFAQTYVHWVGDATQPSHPLLPPSPAISLSQHRGLFQWVSYSHQVAKVLELQL